MEATPTQRIKTNSSAIALQGGLVLAKSGSLALGDNILRTLSV